MTHPKTKMMNSAFPFNLTESYFPPPEKATSEGLLAIGGKLSPDWLVDAYAHGIFPWYGKNEPILWWTPPLRPILEPHKIHISQRLKREIRRFQISFDTAFEKVITACSIVPRPRQNGTWITPEMLAAYIRLHEYNLAHSIEVWEDGKLAGGLYGVSLGRVFFGESMFHLKTNASKVGFIALCKLLARLDFAFVDCQQETPHMMHFGAKNIHRSEFLQRLERAVSLPPPDWEEVKKESFI